MSESAKTVLLVEDEVLNRALVRAILVRSHDPRLSGLEVVEAGSLAAGRAALSTGKFDIILLDAQLPDGSGLDLARELPPVGTPGRPVVITFTAGILPEQRAAATAAGCDAFLGKPFAQDELRELLLEVAFPQTADEPDVEGIEDAGVSGS